MEQCLLSLREQYNTNSRGNGNSEIAVGDIVNIRNDQTKHIFWKVAKVEQLLQGDDGATRAAQVRVLRGDSNRTQLLQRSIQELIPIEVKAEGERDNERKYVRHVVGNEQVLRPTERQQRDAAINGQLRRLKDMNKL